ncbi:hypothetical protein C7271_13245 [filamentous cyanobacterium CCP5]|nr:hypothetical protein C7271_13245 [filamentous cyanobacterium CCP5]
MGPLQRLEQYTIRQPQEVLIVTAEVEGEIDQVVVFKGFSSSLMRPTAFDPDVPVLPEAAHLQTVDRLQGPYSPDHPRYLEQGVPWPVFAERLGDLGL